MNFSAIFQLKTKKFWWMDVIFYFVISLLIATLLCWLIFLIKNNIQRQEIGAEVAKLQTVGTDDQKTEEKDVINYQGKISDFSNLLRNHEFASNIFAFMQAQTAPNIWFKQFSLDEKNAEVQLSGESDDIDTFSRQVAIFEKNKYVKSIGTLNSALGASARVEFNIGLVLDQSIFGYLSGLASISQTVTPAGQSPIQQEQTNNAVTGAPSSEKLIMSFNFLNPQAIGVIDESNHAIALNVPYGTDVKDLAPEIIISDGATVLPASDASQDFAGPVTYIVTAQDGSTQEYTVRVVIGAKPEAKKQSGNVVLGIIISICIILVGAGLAVLFIRKKNKGQGQKKIPDINNPPVK